MWALPAQVRILPLTVLALNILKAIYDSFVENFATFEVTISSEESLGPGNNSYCLFSPFYS
jgi:hypothetical protein